MSDPAGTTVVLVHGAFADASGFGGVIRELLSAGHEVVAPPNPLRSVAFDASALSAAVKAIEGPVLLVGHSYGGAVITQAGPDLYVRKDQFRETFCADVPVDVAEVMCATQRPLSLAALTEKATQAAWKTKPSWYLVSQQDNAIPPDAERFMAHRMGAVTEEIDGSHTAFIAQPVRVAGFIRKALAG